MSYTVISADDFNTFIQEVNAKKDEGYIPTGGINLCQVIEYATCGKIKDTKIIYSQALEEPCECEE